MHLSKSRQWLRRQFAVPTSRSAPAGPAEFVNLQGLLVQSSKWFGISSVQFGFLVTSLSRKLIQFSSGHGGQVSPFSSVHSFHELFRPWLGLTWLARFGSGPVKSIEPPIVWEEQRSSSRPPPAEIPAHRPGICRLGGGMVHFAGCACLLGWGVMCCRSDAMSVQNHLKRVRTVQFACLIRSAASSFSTGYGDTGYDQFSSVHELFRPSSAQHYRQPQTPRSWRSCQGV